MLGLARASQLAGWGGDVPVRVAMESTSSMNYAVYQTPSFAWLSDDGSSGTFNYNPSTNILSSASMDSATQPGVIDLEDYTLLPGYSALKGTEIVTCRVDLPPGLIENQGFKFGTAWRGTDSGFSAGNWAWVHGYGGDPRLTVNAGFVQSVVLPGTDYQDYNGTTITNVWSYSDNSADFLDWDPPFDNPNANFYSRLSVYNTETGALIAREDSAVDFEPYPPGQPSDLTVWMTPPENPTESATTNSNSGFAYVWGGTGGTDANCTAHVSQVWSCFGTMFDPAQVTDLSWLTTRPNAQIASAQAWLNIQFANTQEINNFERVWVTQSSQDLYNQNNAIGAGHQLQLISFQGTPTVFSQRSDTTPIKSRG